MKRLILAVVLGVAATVAACDEPQQTETIETAPPVEAPVAPSVEENAAPAVETAPATDATPTDNATLPAEERTSEETVQPESETLFY